MGSETRMLRSVISCAAALSTRHWERWSRVEEVGRELPCGIEPKP